MSTLIHAHSAENSATNTCYVSATIAFKTPALPHPQFCKELTVWGLISHEHCIPVPILQNRPASPSTVAFLKVLCLHSWCSSIFLVHTFLNFRYASMVQVFFLFSWGLCHTMGGTWMRQQQTWTWTVSILCPNSTNFNISSWKHRPRSFVDKLEPEHNLRLI